LHQLEPNPLFGRVQTVGDLAKFITLQPSFSIVIPVIDEEMQRATGDLSGTTAFAQSPFAVVCGSLLASH
jgi:hypothetical protein